MMSEKALSILSTQEEQIELLRNHAPEELLEVCEKSGQFRAAAEDLRSRNKFEEAADMFIRSVDDDDIINDDDKISETDSEQESSTRKQKKKVKPDINLTNIKLVYLPPNTTAHLQPMDAGVINSFKAKYKQEFCKHLIWQFDSGIDHIK